MDQGASSPCFGFFRSWEEWGSPPSPMVSGFISSELQLEAFTRPKDCQRRSMLLSTFPARFDPRIDFLVGALGIVVEQGKGLDLRADGQIANRKTTGVSPADFGGVFL